MISLHIPGLTHEQQALAQDIRQEISLLLYQRQIWSLGQAAQFAQIPYVDVQTLLAERRIPLNYDQAAWEEDLATVEDCLAE
mgnify:CR=1 FL=1